MNKVILSVLGHDRPGIIAAAANILFKCNCNIENVSQTILKTEFAGSFIISMPPDLTQEELRQALNEGLAAMNMHIHIEAVLKQKIGACFQQGRTLCYYHQGTGPQRTRGQYQRNHRPLWRQRHQPASGIQRRQ